MREDFGGRYSFIRFEYVDRNVTAVEEVKLGALKMMINFHLDFFEEKHWIGRFAFKFTIEGLNFYSTMFLL